MITMRTANKEDIQLIMALAEKIWRAAYRPILSKEQIDYMMEMIYSESSLNNQMEELQHQFLLVYEEKEPVGFAAYAATPEPGIYKLHKIYVSSELQGKGIGRLIIDEVVKRTKSIGATILELNVNRHNKARFFYEKLGFIIHDKVDIPIGEGYFMNDYVMRKEID